MQPVRFGALQLVGFKKQATFLSKGGAFDEIGQEAKAIFDAALHEDRIGKENHRISDLAPEFHQDRLARVLHNISDNLVLEVYRDKANANDAFGVSLKQVSKQGFCSEYQRKGRNRLRSVSSALWSNVIFEQKLPLETWRKGGIEIIDQFLAKAMEVTVAEKFDKIIKEVGDLHQFLKLMSRRYRPHTELEVGFKTEANNVAANAAHQILYPDFKPETVYVLTAADTAPIGEHPQEVLKWLNIDPAYAKIGRLEEDEQDRLDSFKQAVTMNPRNLIQELNKMLNTYHFETSMERYLYREQVRSSDHYKVFETVLAKKLLYPPAVKDVALNTLIALESALRGDSSYQPSDAVKSAFQTLKFRTDQATA